jgi:thioredoxin 1
MHKTMHKFLIVFTLAYATIHAHPLVTEIRSNAQFETEVLQARRLVVVDFYAPWCGPCKNLAPVLEALAEQNKDVSMIKINIDEALELKARFNIRSIPTVYLFKNGKQVEVLRGPSRRDLQKAIDAHKH